MIFADDARIWVYPLERYRDSTLFPSDYLGDYAKACTAIGYRGFYWLTTSFASASTVSKILPYVLLLVVICAIGIGAARFGGLAAAWLAVALCLSTDIFLRKLGGGLPRGFAFPMLACSAAALIYGRAEVLAIITCLAAALYPPAALVCGLTLAVVLLLLPASDRGTARQWSLKRRLWVLALTVIACAGVVTPTSLGLRRYGPYVRSADIANYPEAGSQGRFYEGLDRPGFGTLPHGISSVALSALMGSGKRWFTLSPARKGDHRHTDTGANQGAIVARNGPPSTARNGPERSTDADANQGGIVAGNGHHRSTNSGASQGAIEQGPIIEDWPRNEEPSSQRYGQGIPRAVLSMMQGREEPGILPSSAKSVLERSTGSRANHDGVEHGQPSEDSKGEPDSSRRGAHSGKDSRPPMVWLILALAAIAFVGLMTREASARRLSVLFLTACVSHVLATRAFPYLYLPQRYLAYPIPVFVILMVAAAASTLPLGKIGRDRAWVRPAATIACGVLCLLLMGRRGSPVAGLDLRVDDRTKVYTFFETLSKDALVAGWPEGIMENVPYLAKRQAFITRELHQPFNVGFANELRVRMKAFLEAYTATDAEPLRRLRDRFGVTHMLIDRRHFDEGRTPSYFAPFDEWTGAAFASGRTKGFFLPRAAESLAVFEEGPIAVLDLARLDREEGGSQATAVGWVRNDPGYSN